MGWEGGGQLVGGLSVHKSSKAAFVHGLSTLFPHGRRRAQPIGEIHISAREFLNSQAPI